MGILKQLIYTATARGYGVWGQSASFPAVIASDGFVVPMFEYKRPPSAVAEFDKNPELDPDTLFPIRRKYSRVGEKYVFVRVNYLGRELMTDRMGNKFLHILVSDGPIKAPIVYFSQDGLFRTALVGDERQLKKCAAPLDDISDDGFTADGAYGALCEYVNGNWNRLAPLTALYKNVLQTIDDDNAHLVIYNAGLGRDLWALMQCIMCLLSYDQAVKFTFDTHFFYSRTPECLRVRDKLVAFYGELPNDFRSYSEYGHKYITLDFSKLGADDENSEEEKAVIGKVFALGPAGLKAYTQLLECAEGEGLQRSLNTVALVTDISAKFSDFPISTVCAVYKAAKTGVVTQDVCDSLIDLVDKACRNGIGELGFVIDCFGEYECLKSALQGAVARGVSDGAFMDAVAAELWSGDESGETQKLTAVLKTVLPEYRSFESGIQKRLLKLVTDNAQDFCSALISDDIYNRYALIVKYCPAVKQVIESAVVELYATRQKKLIKQFLTEDADCAKVELKRYIKFGKNIDESEFYTAACEKFITATAIKAIIGGSEKQTATAAELITQDSCRKMLAKAVREYIVDNCNKRTDLDAALTALADSNLSALADEKAIFRTIVNTNAMDDGHGNAGMLRAFAVEYVEGLPVESRFAATYDEKLKNDGSREQKSKLEALHKTLFGYALDIMPKPITAQSLLELIKKYEHIDLNTRILIAADRKVDLQEIREVLPSVMPRDGYSETLGLFLENDGDVAELYVDAFLKITVTDSLLFTLLSEYPQYPGALEKIEAYGKEFFTCLSANGIRSAKSVYESLVDLFEQNHDGGSAPSGVAQIKDMLVKLFVKKYGKSMFLPDMVRKYGVVGGSKSDELVKAATETEITAKYTVRGGEDAAENYFAYLEYAGRNNKARTKEFDAYTAAGGQADDKLIKRLLLRLDLCELSLSDVSTFKAAVLKSKANYAWLVDALEFTALAVSGKRVTAIKKHAESKLADWLYSYIAWALAKASIDGKVSAETAAIIYSVIGDEYCVAFSELIADSVLRGKLKGLAKLYPTVKALSPTCADKMQNSIEYMNLNDRFRKKIDKIFTDNK